MWSRCDVAHPNPLTKQHSATMLPAKGAKRFASLRTTVSEHGAFE